MASRTNCIPARPFVSVVESLLEMKDTGDAGSDLVLVSPMKRLEHDSGLSRRSLYMLFKGHTKWVRFNVADKILCALGSAHLWRVPPLDEHYLSVRIPDTTAVKREREQPVRSVCSGPNCYKRITIRPGGSRRKYCSQSCKSRAQRFRDAIRDA